MKKLLFVLLLCSACICSAQEKISYADFIQTDTAVKWAAIYNSCINLTASSPNFSIRDFYFNKLKKGSVNAYTEDSTYLKVAPVNIGYDDVIKKLYHPFYYGGNWMNNVFTYDGKKDAYEQIFIRELNECDTCFNNRLQFFKLKQLLFYKDHQLQIKNILLTPLLYKKIDGSPADETQFTESMNVAFDNSAKETMIPAAAVLIGRSCNNLKILPSTNDAVSTGKILTLNDWSLTRHLFNDAKKGILKFYGTEKGLYSTPASILKKDAIERYHRSPVQVAVYDSTGELHGVKKIFPEINLDSFYNYTIVQDFYFDFKNEKLYSKLIAFVIRENVVTSSGLSLGLTDHWGVIFPAKKKVLRK